jgi:hypothetical protein
MSAVIYDMKFRKLRITWTICCGIACVLLCVLWCGVIHEEILLPIDKEIRGPGWIL